MVLYAVYMITSSYFPRNFLKITFRLFLKTRLFQTAKKEGIFHPLDFLSPEPCPRQSYAVSVLLYLYVKKIPFYRVLELIRRLACFSSCFIVKRFGALARIQKIRNGFPAFAIHGLASNFAALAVIRLYSDCAINPEIAPFNQLIFPVCDFVFCVQHIRTFLLVFH